MLSANNLFGNELGRVFSFLEGQKRGVADEVLPKKLKSLTSLILKPNGQKL